MRRTPACLPPPPSPPARLNRVRVLVVAAAADAAVMACLAFVPSAPRAAQTPLLYALLALQFSAAGFYEPGGGCGEALMEVGGCCAATTAWHLNLRPRPRHPSLARSPQGAGARAGACRRPAPGCHHRLVGLEPDRGCGGVGGRPGGLPRGRPCRMWGAVLGGGGGWVVVAAGGGGGPLCTRQPSVGRRSGWLLNDA